MLQSCVGVWDIVKKTGNFIQLLEKENTAYWDSTRYNNKALEVHWWEGKHNNSFA